MQLWSQIQWRQLNILTKIELNWLIPIQFFKDNPKESQKAIDLLNAEWRQIQVRINSQEPPNLPDLQTLAAVALCRGFQRKENRERWAFIFH